MYAIRSYYAGVQDRRDPPRAEDRQPHPPDADRVLDVGEVVGQFPFSEQPRGGDDRDGKEQPPGAERVRLLPRASPRPGGRGDDPRSLPA